MFCAHAIPNHFIFPNKDWTLASSVEGSFKKVSFLFLLKVTAENKASVSLANRLDVTAKMPVPATTNYAWRG
jgi:hypothetical protein